MTEMKRQGLAIRSWRPAKLTWPLLCICLLVATTSWGVQFGDVDLTLRSTTEYRYAWSDDSPKGFLNDDDDDQDFSQHLGLDMNWEEYGITFSAMGRYVKDLDGTADGSIFQNYTDSRGDHRQDFEAYYAYLEKRDLFVDGLNVRAGRQYSYGAETVHFDGLHISYSRPDWAGFEISAFGGNLVHHYTDLTRDEVGGYNLALHPTSNLALTLDGVLSDNNSTEGGLYWQITDYIQSYARLAFIDDSERFLDIGTQALLPQTGTVINIGIYHRYDVDLDSDYLFDYSYTFKNALSTRLTSLYLLQEQAYTDYDLKISQPVPQLKGLTIYGRYTKRVLNNDNEEDLYNTDFDRYSAGINLDEFMGLKGFHLDTGYSFWQEDRSMFYEGESTSYYADLRQELNKFEIRAGFYHKSEDVNSRIEDEAATRYEAALKYHYMDNSWVEVLYQYDQDDYFEDELGVDYVSALTLTLHQEF